MRRHLLTLLVALSLMTCVATALFWARSATHGDQAFLVIRAGDRYWCMLIWSYQHACSLRLTGAQDRPHYKGNNPWVRWAVVRTDANYDPLYRSAPVRLGSGRFVLASFSHWDLDATTARPARYHTWDWAVTLPHEFVGALAAIAPAVCGDKGDIPIFLTYPW